MNNILLAYQGRGKEETTSEVSMSQKIKAVGIVQNKKMQKDLVPKAISDPRLGSVLG